MKPASSITAQSPRLQFIDDIRWSMIVLVIFHHSAVTYSHVGGWYYFEDPAPTLGTTLLLGTFLAFNQAYFMSFLLLIAGYFVAPSFDRKGFAEFLRERFVRLGIPSLLFMLVIHPFIVYWLLRNSNEPAQPSFLRAYGSFLLSGRVLGASGPMWFALALLIFCVLYAIGRLRSKEGRPAGLETRWALPRHAQVFFLALLMAGATFVVRIFQPEGTSILNMQLCYFTQYITLFCIGIVAYRRDWLLRIPFAFGMVWLRLALTVGVLLWVAVLQSSGVLNGAKPTKILGGLYWQSALHCFWESFVCMGMCLGLLVLYRDRLRVKPALAAFMSRNAFSAYLFHTPLLIAVTLSLHQLSLPVTAKFLLAGVLAASVTFLASEFVFRRTPLLREVL